MLVAPPKGLMFATFQAPVPKIGPSVGDGSPPDVCTPNSEGATGWLTDVPNEPNVLPNTEYVAGEVAT